MLPFVDDCKDFEQSPVYRVKTDQINALGSHDGGKYWKSQQFHPQAVHKLLDYLNTNTSFTKRGKKNKAIKHKIFWIELKWNFWEKYSVQEVKDHQP